LNWLLAHSPHLVPIPGARTVAHARENAEVLAQGPLDREQMDAIESELATFAAGGVGGADPH
jgi:aryl-alcohol dehydrogenase-like predicted oxidoreductase